MRTERAVCWPAPGHLCLWGGYVILVTCGG